MRDVREREREKERERRKKRGGLVGGAGWRKEGCVGRLLAVVLEGGRSEEATGGAVRGAWERTRTRVDARTQGRTDGRTDGREDGWGRYLREKCGRTWTHTRRALRRASRCPPAVSSAEAARRRARGPGLAAQGTGVEWEGARCRLAHRAASCSLHNLSSSFSLSFWRMTHGRWVREHCSARVRYRRTGARVRVRVGLEWDSAGCFACAARRDKEDEWSLS